MVVIARVNRPVETLFLQEFFLAQAVFAEYYGGGRFLFSVGRVICAIYHGLEEGIDEWFVLEPERSEIIIIIIIASKTKMP